MDNVFLSEKRIVTEIVLAILVPAGTGSAVHKNRASHGLAFNVSGEKDYIFDDGSVLTVKENDIIYLPKRSNYEVATKTRGDIYCVNFQCLDEKVFSPFVFHISNAEEVLKAYQNAEKAWKRGKEGREYRVLSELYRIFYEMRRLQSAPYFPKAKQDLIKPAIDYIHKHYTEELVNMERLSRLCGISYDYLRQLFEKIYGCSPIKYINHLKLKRAKELLSSGLCSVAEAAFNAGFSDLSHFSRFFKDNVGVSPSEYRLGAATARLDG